MKINPSSMKMTEKQLRDMAKTVLKYTDNEEEFSKFIKTQLPQMHGALNSSFPRLHTVLSMKKINNARDGEKNLLNFVTFLELKFKVKIDRDVIVKGFYSVYGYLIKLLTVLNLAGFMYLWGAAGTAALAVVCTIAIMYNSIINKISLEQSIKNFKTSFSEYMKRKIPTKRERDLAIIPFFIMSAITVILMSTGLLSAFTALGGAVGLFTIGSSSAPWITSISSVAVIWAVYLYIKASIVYFLMEVMDEWILRKGKSTSEEI
jgi:hypothetical protein